MSDAFVRMVNRWLVVGNLHIFIAYSDKYPFGFSRVNEKPFVDLARDRVLSSNRDQQIISRLHLGDSTVFPVARQNILKVIILTLSRESLHFACNWSEVFRMIHDHCFLPRRNCLRTVLYAEYAIDAARTCKRHGNVNVCLK